jgi:membrane-bound serine protease (ClpP class)
MRSLLATLIFILTFGLQLSAHAEPTCYIEANVNGAIGPASLDFIQRAQRRVTQNKCGSVLLLINTPGGSLQTTRLIVEEIVNSKIPFLCLVYPSGGHAGSAGAIILQSCHIAGAMETTNIGAATPVSGGGEQIPEDLRKKLLNDTRSWVEGLARLRGRSEQFARDIVEHAKAVSADEALKLKAIDVVAKSKEDFIQFSQNKTVKLDGNTETKLEIGAAVPFAQDLRYKVMDLLMNPQVAYLIFMGSLGLLYFELTHPGMIAPGVIGGVGLILSLVSLHMLDVTWGAVLLILVGIAFMIAEAFVAGFGILGVGGIVAFFVGSLFLFDPEQSGYVLPLSTVLPTTIVLGAVMIGIAYLAFSTRKAQKHGGFDDLEGHVGLVSQVDPEKSTHGFIEIEGELWKVESAEPLTMGVQVVVLKHHGLTLEVKKKV